MYTQQEPIKNSQFACLQKVFEKKEINKPEKTVKGKLRIFLAENRVRSPESNQFKLARAEKAEKRFPYENLFSFFSSFFKLQFSTNLSINTKHILWKSRVNWK